MAAADESFQLVRKRKGKSRPRQRNREESDCLSMREECNKSSEDVINLVTSARETVSSSEFYKSLKDLLSDADSRLKTRLEDQSVSSSGLGFVCYGLGNFSSCPIAKYQLALVQCLTHDLKIPSNDCHMFDPRFSATEQNVLQMLGYSVIQENEEGKRSVTQSTLFYLPHCGKPLYNNLLWANWDYERLKHLLILGNSFQNMANSCPSRILQKEAKYISRILPYVSEFAVKNNFEHSDIFNDTALHTFHTSTLSKIEPELWTDNVEPKYDTDVEIIQKDSHG